MAWMRSRGHCEGCWHPLGSEGALHHRQLLSQGGPDCLCNVVILHPLCHNLGTDSVHNRPKISRGNGLMVSAYAKPEDEAVLLGAMSAGIGGGTRVLLPCDALSYVPLAPVSGPH